MISIPTAVLILIVAGWGAWPIALVMFLAIAWIELASL